MAATRPLVFLSLAILGVLLFGCVNANPTPFPSLTPVVVTATITATPTPAATASLTPPAPPEPTASTGTSCKRCVVDGQYTCRLSTESCSEPSEPLLGTGCRFVATDTDATPKCRSVTVVPFCQGTTGTNGVTVVADSCSHADTPAPSAQNPTPEPTVASAHASVWTCVKDAGVRIDEDGAGSPHAVRIEDGATRVYYRNGAREIRSRFSAKGLDFGEEGKILADSTADYADPYFFTMTNGASSIFFRVGPTDYPAYSIAFASQTSAKSWVVVNTVVQNAENYAASPSLLRLANNKVRLFFVVGDKVRSELSTVDDAHYYVDEGYRATNAGGVEVFRFKGKTFMTCHTPGLIKSTTPATLFTLQATDAEGMTFSPQSNCADGQYLLGPGPAGSADEMGARNPSFLPIDETSGRVYYEGKDANGKTTILSALCSYKA